MCRNYILLCYVIYMYIGTNEWKIVSELKLDLNNICENNEKPTINSEKIRTKLNRWKSNSSKLIAKNKIDSFLKKEIEPTNDNENDHIEDFEEKQIFNSPLKYIQIIKDNDDKKETIIELGQENVDDVKTATHVDNLNNKTFEFAKHSVDNLNNEINKSYNPCLEIIDEKPSDIKDIKINLKNDININLCKNVPYESSIIETNSSIEIDNSIAPKERKFIVVETNLEQIKQKLKLLASRISGKPKKRSRFYATINSSENHQAESELNREISKDMFSKVKYIICYKYYINNFLYIILYMYI